MSWARLAAVLATVATGAALWASPAAPDQAPLFQRSAEMLKSLSEITGWPVRRPVPARTLRRDDFRKQMETEAKKSDKRAVRAEELTLKMFGLVPWDFDLRGESVDLISEQAAAFYDYKKKQLFVLEGAEDGVDAEISLAHELAHAIADQQNNLNRFMRQGNPSDDAQTAREAVMEGQATWLSLAYLSQHMGGPPEVPMPLLSQFMKMVGAAGDDFPVYTQAPLYIRQSLTFPYSEGLRFADEVYRALGRKGFSETFERPPDATRQILHPDAYLDHEKSGSAAPPELPKDLAKKVKQLGDGDIGEEDAALILESWVGEGSGSEQASHWRGGKYRIYEWSASKKPLLAHAIEWDTEASAQAYADMYQRVMRAKWKSYATSSSAADTIVGSGDTGRFLLKRTGRRVEVFEGLQ